MQFSTLFWPLLIAGALALPQLPARSVAPLAQGAVAREIYGNVNDFKGAPVAGASVALTNDSRTLVVTNSEGKFLLKSSASEPSLRITATGYYDTIVVVPTSSAAFSTQLRPVANYKRQFKRKFKATNRAYKK